MRKNNYTNGKFWEIKITRVNKITLSCLSESLFQSYVKYPTILTGSRSSSRTTFRPSWTEYKS